MTEMKSEENKKFEELIDKIERICSAYRRSYKLLSGINKTLLITSGILSSAAVLAMVPVIPVFIAGVSAVPIVIIIVNEKLKLSEKVDRLKKQYIFYKGVLTHLQSEIFAEDKRAIYANSLTTSLDHIEQPPLEIFMKKYKLNGYT